jgi:arylsulfatase A-like enzyme
MNFQSSHFPYLLPEGTPQPFQPADLADDVKFSSYPVERTENVRNAYYNAIHECDRQVGRVMRRLEELGIKDDTIVVVTGENGEAFHEAGCVGHAGLPVEPVVHVAAVIHGPSHVPQGREDYPFEHVDLVPTVLGLMGLPSHDNFQGLDIRRADRPEAAERLLYFHVISPIARADAVLLGGRWKWMTSHNHPAGVLYDIEQDRSESIDVQRQHPELARQLREQLDRWRRQQLAYYHYPEYYLRYYPPLAPRWPSSGTPKIGQ